MVPSMSSRRKCVRSRSIVLLPTRWRLQIRPNPPFLSSAACVRTHRTRKTGDNVGFQKREVMLCRVLLVVLLLIISYFAFTPIRYPVLEVFSDKLKHSAAFFALAASADFSFPERPFGLP